MNSRNPKTHELTALMISPDREMAGQFNDTLSRSCAFQVVADLKAYPSPHSLEIRLRQVRPDVVLLDLASDSGTAADLLQFLTTSNPSVHVVGLSPRNDREILLNSLRLGASEFLHAPFEIEHQNEAVSRLKRLRQPDSESDSPLGTITVFSNAKPGCGASTLALYSAIALRRLTGKRVLLADFDLKGGMLGFYAGVTSSNSIVDSVALAAELTPALWSSMVVDLDGLDVLASPDAPFTRQIDSERLNAVLHFTRTQYDYVLIDLPVVFDRWSLVGLSNSERALLVSTPELPSLHLARRAVQVLQQFGFPKDRFQILLNRVNRKEDISRANIEKLFDCPIYCDFPNDFYSLNRVVTLGQQLDPSSELSRAVDSFASKLAGMPAAAQKSASLGNLLRA